MRSGSYNNDSGNALLFSLNTEASIALIVLLQLLVTGGFDFAKSYLRRDKTKAEAKAVETKAEADAKTADANVEAQRVENMARLITATESFAGFVNTLVIQRDSQEVKIAELQRDSLDKERRINQLEEQGKLKDRQIADLEAAVAAKDKQIAELEDTYQKKIAKLEKNAKENEQALASALIELRNLRDQDLEQLRLVKEENARLKEELEHMKNEGERALLTLPSAMATQP